MNEKEIEIDLFLATKVMGWKECKSPIDATFPCVLNWGSFLMYYENALVSKRWSPSKNAADAMEVWRACLDNQMRLNAGDPIMSKDGGDYWIRTVVGTQHIEGCAKTLELAIARFAVALFTPKD